MPKFRLRGDQNPGIQDSYVDLKAVNLLFIVLPWLLAIEAIVRGWEYFRIDWEIVREGRSVIARLAAEDFFGIQFFGTAVFVAGVIMLAGLLLRRYALILSACLVGGASYLMLASGYAYQALVGDGYGLRGAATFFMIATLWGLKGYVSASKKSAQERAQKLGVCEGEGDC